MSIKDSILSHSNQFNYYKEETEKLKDENEKLKKKNDKLKNESKRIKEELENSKQFENGISIIIPTYKGENHIHPLLDSLEKQTLSPELYEIIFVINGEPDSTMDILIEFIDRNPEKNVILTYTPKLGVCNARNIGIRLANREYTTFSDDDDFISENYLEKLYEHSRPNRIVMTNYIYVNDETKEELESYLDQYPMDEYGIIKKAPVKCFQVAAKTPAKSIPTYATKSVQFNTDFTTGEDVTYYGYLYSKFDFEFYFIDEKENVNFYIVKRKDSASRKEMTYQFNVIDRFEVITDLNNALNEAKEEKYKKFIKIGIEGQSGFIKRYLEKNPNEKERVCEDMKKYSFSHFPYDFVFNSE